MVWSGCLVGSGTGGGKERPGGVTNGKMLAFGRVEVQLPISGTAAADVVIVFKA